ncbi:MAG: hypothetical protein LBH00_07590 [Planctomycetaceae bacterium]|jgi:hypothetical protein|nr:hypothetical protein [Planctomycetaceae bacterium]
MQTILTWIIPPHAKERLEMRYGIRFSGKKWDLFCKTLQNGKNAVMLPEDKRRRGRFACYFQNQWFIVSCCFYGTTAVVTTFLPVDSLSEADKVLLQNDERYCRINRDSLNVCSCGRLRNPPPVQKSMPDIPVLPDELPPDFDLAEKLLGTVDVKMNVS